MANNNSDTTKVFDKFQAKMRELFQMDRADLDFGMYRIMNAKRDEINDYLGHELYIQVGEVLQKYSGHEKQQKLAELEEARKAAKQLGVDPAQSTKVQKLEQEINKAIDTEDLERSVFSHLFTFFSRYYDKGDFISKRRYKDGTYMIPYEGEEVKLVWANMDQYYIKTSEYLRDYTFLIGTDGSRRVHFKLTEAEESRDNTKPSNGNRRFDLADDPVSIEGTEMVVRFIFKEYPKGKQNQQDQINKRIAENILDLSGDFKPYLEQRVSDNSDRRMIDKHVNGYTARNSFDYFIHKDLGGFLRRELDYYIKNEVMRIEDIEGEDSVKRIESYLDVIRSIKLVGDKIIVFLAHIEEFQKRLWLKKKFVIDSGYCVTMDRVPEELWEQVAANFDQAEEWKQLGFLETPKQEVSKKWLTDNPYAMIDTRFYDKQFKDTLLSSFENIDEATDGLIINSENFQALNLLKERYREKIRCIHIDPPYNTATSGFLYKNNYQHSSWLSMMSNRIAASEKLLGDEGSFLCHIDENEYENLYQIFEVSELPNAGTLIWDKKNPMLGRKGLATQHEYIICRSKNLGPIMGRSEAIKKIIKFSKELINGNGKVDDYIREKFRKWISKQQEFTGGEKAYKYLDDNGDVFRLVAMGAPEKRLDPKFHIPLKHPVTGKKCPVPPNGWSRTPETISELIEKKLIIFGKDETTQPQKKVYLRDDAQKQLTTIYSDGRSGKEFIDSMKLEFPYCHPVSMYEHLQSIVTDDFILDYFAGSGTTAHAVININREDGGSRKYILVEMGQYFDTVLKPRIQKVVYADTWKNGKPVRRDDGSTGGSSHVLKYLKLESYEDTLNNLEVHPTGEYSKLKQLGMDGRDFREGFMLNYFLDHDTDGADLSTTVFRNPFDYELQVATGNVGETKPVNVDLVETFKYLIGLTVEQRWTARSCLFIEGYDAEENKVLIVWRTVEEVPNDKLSEIFKKQEIRTRDREYDLIYINGDNNIENIRFEEERWKVRLIEHEFRARMFASETGRE